MKRITLFLWLMAGVIFLRNSTAVGVQETDIPLWEVCKIAEPRDLSWEYVWRWRAEQNLTCLINKLSQSVPSTAEQGVVMLSHQEIRQLQSLAWSARDAAQRIGR